MTKEQVQAFLDSLYPLGEHSYISNHTLTYYGDVPKLLYGDCKHLAAVLRDVADQLEEEN